MKKHILLTISLLALLFNANAQKAESIFKSNEEKNEKKKAVR